MEEKNLVCDPVCKEVYTLQVSVLKEVDQDQEQRLQRLEDRVEGQFQRVLLYLSIIGSLILGSISLIHSFIH